MRLLLKIFTVLLFASVFSFGQELARDSLGKAQSAQEILSVQAVSEHTETVEEELKQEIALRDSVMAAHDSACAVEKDSLRKAASLDSNMCENWKQSYDTMKKNNEVCAQALSISLGVNEKNKEEVEETRRSAATMSSTSFLGGIALGMLLFWLIFE